MALEKEMELEEEKLCAQMEVARYVVVVLTSVFMYIGIRFNNKLPKEESDCFVP